ncbi:hypothetical protein Tco_0006441 [Tanacetum coccineum]
MMVQDQEEVGEGSKMPTDLHHTPTIIQPLTSQPQKKQRLRRSKRKDTQVPQSSIPSDNVANEAVNEEMDDSLVRAVTIASSLEAEQDSGNIDKTQSKATLNEPSSSGTSSGTGPKLQETMGDTISQTRSENVSNLSNDLLLARGNTLRSGKDRPKLEELMALFKKLERRKKSRTQGLKRLYKVDSSRRVESSEEEGLGEEDASKQGRISDIDDDAGITLVSTHFDGDIDMFGVHDLDGDEVVVESEARAGEKRNVKEVVVVIDTANTIPVSAATTTTIVITDDEITLAKTLAKLKSAKPPTQATSTRPKVKVQDKVEEEKEERLAREKAQQVEEAKIAWDDVQAKIDADYQLAQRLQAQEQDELTDEEKARLFIQFFEQRRKYFAAKRAEEKMNKQPTRAQQRNIMCTYLKSMEGWKPKSLKNKSFANIQELFDKAMNRVNTFIDYTTELVEENYKKAEAEIAHESSLKRAGEELEQESSKKQKFEEDKESEELKQCLKIVPDDGDGVTIDATHLSTTSPTIVDYKIYKEGKKSYFQIIRADGKTQMYLTFGKMLKKFDKEDMEVLWSIVKANLRRQSQ